MAKPEPALIFLIGTVCLLVLSPEGTEALTNPPDPPSAFVISLTHLYGLKSRKSPVSSICIFANCDPSGSSLLFITFILSVPVFSSSKVTSLKSGVLVGSVLITRFIHVSIVRFSSSPKSLIAIFLLTEGSACNLLEIKVLNCNISLTSES